MIQLITEYFSYLLKVYIRISKLFERISQDLFDYIIICLKYGIWLSFWQCRLDCMKYVLVKYICLNGCSSNKNGISEPQYFVVCKFLYTFFGAFIFLCLNLFLNVTILLGNNMCLIRNNHIVNPKQLLAMFKWLELNQILLKQRQQKIVFETTS